jgi:hypothetical protein
MQTNSVTRNVIAHHEAGHAVGGLVLGVPFTEVRIVPGEDGKIGVPLKGFRRGPGRVLATGHAVFHHWLLRLREGILRR